MKKKSVVPHVLIDGRSRLTSSLYSGCRRKPLVLSARPVTRLVPRAEQWCPTALMMGPAAGRWRRCEDLQKRLDETRRRLQLKDSNALRVVSVGSHGSHWHRECANAGGELGKSAAETMFLEEGLVLEPGSHVGGHLPAAAIEYLSQTRHSRRYINELYEALRGMGGLEFHWLAEIVADELRPAPPTAPETALYGPVAEMARQMLAGPKLNGVQGAVPLLFIRSCKELEWHPFEALPGPSRMNRNLLAQFRDLTEFRRHLVECRNRETTKRRCECVFVKLLSADRSKHNPCDSPMVSTNQLEIARQIGISAVLLDAERGVIARDVDHTKSDTVPVIAF